MDSDNRIFMNKIADYIDLSQDKSVISHTNFLNPYEQSLALGMMRKNNNIKYTFNGG